MNVTLLQNIFVSLVSILPPGNNQASQVPISYCNEVCQITPICDNKSTWHCGVPTLNKDIYTEKTDKLIEKGLSKESAKEEAYNYSFSRPETYEEGLARYYIIATAIEKVSGELSKEKCLSENADKTVCKGKPWYGDQKSLASFISTLIIGESKLSSNVHGGLESGLGDCYHHYKDGKVVRYCNSYGLGQMMQPSLDAHNLGYKKEEIVGLDLFSTEKAILGIAYGLIGAKGICQYRFPKMDSNAAAFSLYGTGNNCKLKYLNDRVTTYYMILYNKKTTNDKILNIMSGKRYKYIYNLLLNSTSQIHKLPEVEFEQISLNKFLVKN